MKKVLKLFLLVPIFIISSLFLFACGEESLKTISLTLPNYEMSGGYYVVKLTDENIPITVSLNPDTFSKNDLSWQSSATDVLTVNNGRFRTRGLGRATITAIYKNKDGSQIKGTLRVVVEANNPDMSFSNDSYTTSYTGTDLSASYKIDQDAGDGSYVYTYYSLENSANVDSIVNAGTYQIRCAKVDNENLFCTTIVKVNNAKLNIVTGNYQMTYGDELPNGLYNANNIPEDFETNNNIGVAVYGLGKDSEAVVGKYITTTTQNSSSSAGSYEIGVYFKLNSEYASNYETEINKEARYLNILKKQVVLQIKNQEISYGEEIVKNNYDLFDYKAYTLNGNSTSGIDSLENASINFKNNMYLGAPSFKLSGSIAPVNEAGCLPVLQEEDSYYELCYDSATTNQNLDIIVKINGKLTIAKKQVVVLPNANQTKIYGEADPEKILYSAVLNGFVFGDEIDEAFLKVKYDLNYDLGEGNFLASVGDYFYEIDNSKNTNYNITLSASAVYEENADNTNKIKFKVNKCPVVVELNSLDTYFKLPTATDVNGNKIHTLSYYNYLDDGTKPSFKTTIKSIKINNREVVNADASTNDNRFSDDYEESGKILLRTGGDFKFSILLVQTQTKEGYYLSYLTSLNQYYFSDGVNGENFLISFSTSQLNLKKILITITPKLTTSLVTKTYDAKGDTPENFGVDYLATGDFEEGMTIQSILINYKELLKLTNGENKHLQLDENKFATGNPKNVGNYKIFLNSNLVYNADMDYYEFVLDASKDYVYTINPLSVVILPSEGKSKIYADADPMFNNNNADDTYYGYTSVPEDVSPTGYLGREVGENVGTYAYTLGSLSFGSNYKLILSPTAVYFTITPRNVKVTPDSYSVTYGSDYPSDFTYISEIVGEYNDKILVKPVFSGKLTLNGEKVGDYYPVKLTEDGAVTDYNILQGTLSCNSNYTIVFQEGGLFRITKRNCEVDIISQKIANKDNLPTSLTLSKSYYTINGLLDGASTTLNVNLKSNDSYVSVKDYELIIKYNNVDVTYCYEITLGKDVVYNIDVTIIYLAIKDTGLTSSFVNKVYTGESQNDNFSIVCQTEGYTIDLDKSSGISFKYASGTNQNVTPKVVGSYVATLSLEGENSKLVIVNNNHNCNEDCNENCEDKYLTFTSLDGGVVQNHVLSISNYGYLNITRASLQYNASKLGFEGDFYYGENNLALNLSTSYLDSENATCPIFYGVNNESITLKNYKYTGEDNEYYLNYSYQKANYAFSSMEASRTYYIDVTVQAVLEDGVTLNNNYNSLNISVPLIIKPKPIIILGRDVSSDNGVLNNGRTTYDGKSKSIKMTLNLQEEVTGEFNNKYAITYSYIRIKTEYSQSVRGSLLYYSYDAVKKVPKISDGVKSTGYDSIKNIVSCEDLNYDGTTYKVINNLYCLLIDSSAVSTPIDAGIYMCFAECASQDNYIFGLSAGNGEYTYSASFSYAYAYEVEKSSNVIISNWKDEFYYTTAFDLNNPSSLPFSFDISPNFKDIVVFSMKEPAQWPSNNILNVGNYTVNLSVENQNYYYQGNQEFKIIKLGVEFVFPSLSTYVYIGNKIPITSFLNNIQYFFKDKDGNMDKSLGSFYYTYGEENSNLVFEFYNADDELIARIPARNEDDILPYEVGSYRMEVSFGNDSSNYQGKGTYNYSIVKKAYSGSVKFQNTSINYNPTYTPTQFYNLIKSKMFSIGLEDNSYTISLKRVDGNVEIVPDDSLAEQSDNWVKNIMNIGQKTIEITVKFNDGITADYVSTAILNIQTCQVLANDFDTSTTNSSFVYTGYEVFNHIKYGGNLLDPNEIKKAGGKIVYNNGIYVYTLTMPSASSVKVEDNLGNEIFTITYSYEQYDSKTSAFKDLKNQAGEAIFPRNPSDYAYRVKYGIVCGRNYNGNAIDIKSKEYKITKVPVLYITMENWDVYYSGADYIKTFKADERLIVKNSQYVTETNMLVNLFTNGNYTSNDDVLNSGVCLAIYYTKKVDNSLGWAADEATNMYENEVAVNSIIDANMYRVYITLLNHSSYNLADYFNKIMINGAIIDVSTFASEKGASPRGGSTISYTNFLKNSYITVNKVSFDNNWKSAFNFSNSSQSEGSIVVDKNTQITNIATGKGVLRLEIYIYRNGNYTLVEGKDNITTTGSYFTDLVEGQTYAIKIICDDNHESNNYINFTIAQTDGNS